MAGGRLSESPSLATSDKQVCLQRKKIINTRKKKKEGKKPRERKTSKLSLNSPCTGRVAITPFSALRLLARKGLGELEGSLSGQGPSFSVQRKGIQAQNSLSPGSSWSLETAPAEGRKQLCSD